jgi:uroporphyrinogen decarboxylase
VDEIGGLDLGRVDNYEHIESVRKSFINVSKSLGDEYMVCYTGWGPFTLAARIVGEERFVKAIYKDKALVEAALEFITDLLIRMFEPMVVDHGLELITLGDPTASGDLISKKQFEKFALPHLERFTSWARDAGTKTLLHICGDTTDRLDSFPKTGADCISLDHKVDMGTAMDHLGGVMCVAGNLDPVKTLMSGTPDQVEEETINILEKAFGKGAFILMPGCDIPPETPIENIKRFIETGKKFAN